MNSSAPRTPPRFPWLRPLFAGILLRPILLAPLLLVLLILAARVGKLYGVPGLFWHELSWVQALAGLGTGLLLGQICFVSYLLDTSEGGWLERAHGGVRWPRLPDRLMRWVVPSPSEPAAHDQSVQLRGYLSVSWLPLLAFLAVLCVVRPAWDLPLPDNGAPAESGTPYWTEAPASGQLQGPAYVFPVTPDWAGVFSLPQRWPFFLGLVAALAVAHLLVRLLHRLHVREVDDALLAFAFPRNPASHLVAAAGFVLLFAVLINANASALALCLTLGLWAAVQGGLIALARLHGVSERERWQHVLAGLAFGAWLLAHGTLFLLYWADTSGTFSHLTTPPALVLCLLLALLVTAYGFLKFHFGGVWVLVAGGLLAVGILVNGRIEFKQRFPGLEDYYADDQYRVALLEADFDTLLAQAGPTVDEGCLTMNRLRRAYDNLCLRGKALAKALGEPEEQFSRPLAPGSTDVIGGRYDAAARELERLEFVRLNRWKAQAGKKGKPKLAVVAVTGGANRSGLWTAFVLNKLEGALDDFPRHVRVITGASGGMVGAAYWTATLPHENPRPSDGEALAFAQKVARDSLTSVAQRLLFADLPMAFIPKAGSRDRGVALEEAWDRNMDGTLDRPFRDLLPDEAVGRRPSLVLSPMLVEDGRQLLISNLYLPFVAESLGASLSDKREAPPTRPDGTNIDMRLSGRVRVPATRQGRPEKRPDRNLADPGTPPGYRYSLAAVEFFNLFPDDGRFKLKTAVRMNASFPYVSPAVDLPITPRRRVVDAGYYDNYGVHVAAAWIHHYRRWLRENTSGVVLIQIRDRQSEDRRLYANTAGEGWGFSRGIEWLTGPLVGAGSARESGMAFRNDEQLVRLTEYFNRKGAKDLFTTAVFESREELAISWYLTQNEIAHVERNFKPEDSSSNARTLKELGKWWAGPKGKAP